MSLGDCMKILGDPDEVASVAGLVPVLNDGDTLELSEKASSSRLIPYLQ
jgi:hypothetical protein